MPDLTPKQIRTLYGMAPEGAISYLESLGIAVTWDWKEQLSVIRRRAFTVAKVAKADVLQAVHDELKKASTSGVSYEQWKESTSAMLRTKGWSTKDDGSAWRLDTIFRTNMQSAYHAGRYERLRGTSDRFGFWQYRAVGDRRSRPKHRELDGLILPREHPFWKRVFPPNGFMCRCSVVALTEEQARALGYRPPTGSTAITPTGQTVRLAGKDAWSADTGFDGVPGQPLDVDTGQYAPAIGAGLAADLRRKGKVQTDPLVTDVDPEDAGPGYGIDDLDAAFEIDQFYQLYRATGENRKARKEDGIDRAQETSITFYTSDNYLWINEQLREKPDPRTEAVARIMNSAVKKMARTSPRRLYRGIRMMGKELEEFLERYQVGKVVTESAFTSTSADGRKASEFGRSVLMRITQTDRAASVSHMSKYPDEMEWLLPTGTSFRVDDILYDSRWNRYVIDVTVV